MKFLHLGDLHIGKRLNNIPLLEDQRYILGQILDIAREEQPDAVLIAGDVYDRTLPPAEAVTLLDDFLTALAGEKIPVFLISGNHDSAERLAFGGRLLSEGGVHLSPVYDGELTPYLLEDEYGTVAVWLLSEGGVHLSPVYDGELTPYVLEDEYGTVAVWLLPFIRPAHVRAVYPDADITSYTQAVQTALAQAAPAADRQVLVAHQFVTGAAPGGSEEFAVGGVENVDASVFDAFDYVALGHIHSAQEIRGAGTIRYCGAPLAYSVSEAGQEKSVTIAELGKKGEVTVRIVPLSPLRRLRKIRGSYEELTRRSTWQGTAVEDYLQVTLTDEQDIPDAIAKLRSIYPNILELRYDNARTRAFGKITAEAETERRTPMELFAALYEQQNGAPLSPEQIGLLERLIREIWEEEEA